jgi:queuine tRNA-ribosyltransferase
MGVGRPGDIVGAVRRGVDMFDCVMPTRSGRTGQLFTPNATLNIRNARHADDPRPVDADCRCPLCRNYSRGYLHHLFGTKEILGAMLATWHNLTHYQDLMASLRGAIARAGLDVFATRHEQLAVMGDIDPI